MTSWRYRRGPPNAQLGRQHQRQAHRPATSCSSRRSRRHRHPRSVGGVSRRIQSASAPATPASRPGAATMPSGPAASAKCRTHRPPNCPTQLWARLARGGERRVSDRKGCASTIKIHSTPPRCAPPGSARLGSRGSTGAATGVFGHGELDREGDWQVQRGDRRLCPSPQRVRVKRSQRKMSWRHCERFLLWTHAAGVQQNAPQKGHGVVLGQERRTCWRGAP